jgi:hypothetical protein
MNQRMSISLEHTSYQSYLCDLMTAAVQCQLAMTNIGTQLVERTAVAYPLYELVVNAEAAETICVVAGTHGADIAGPLSLLRLLDESLDDLPARFRYVLFPLVNPCGFDMRQRGDRRHGDLKPLYLTSRCCATDGGVRALSGRAAQYGSFTAVITLGEDSDTDRFYMYGLGEQNIEFYHRLCRVAGMRCPCWCNAAVDGFCSDDEGLILAAGRDHAVGSAFYTQGLASVELALEIPGKCDIAFRVGLMQELLLSAVLDLAQRAEAKSAPRATRFAACHPEERRQ